MSPVNTFGSNLRVETNLNGEMIDNEEFIQYQNNQRHSHNPTEPWQRGYTAEVDEQLVKELLEPSPAPVEDNPDIRTANNNDLKIRNLNR
jgi:hypothetical protein